MKLHMFIVLVFATLLIACSPAKKAASADPAFEIAKSQRDELAKADAISAEMEKAVAAEKQKIDEQSQ